MKALASRLIGLAVASAAAILPVAGYCETYPSRPIRFVLGSAPGSVLDVAARQLANQLQAQIGQPVIVENRPTAGGIVALDNLKKSPPDGYTLDMVAMAHMSVSPGLFAHLPYDPLSDFAHVGILFRGPQLLVVNASVPVSTFGEFVALAASRPHGLTYSSPAVGSPGHILMEEVRFQAHANLRHIPYKGPSANAAVVSGEVDALLEGVSQMAPLIEAGKLRALAVTGDHRIEAMPDVPTFRELGIRDIDAVWVGVVAPRATPASVVDYLNRELARAVLSPEIRTAYEQVGRSVVPGSPQQMTATITAEIPRWRAVIQRAGIIAE